MGRKIIIENVLVAEELLTSQFCCNIRKCHGACCVEGDAGAPLEKEEILRIEEHLDTIQQFMSDEGRKAVQHSGVFERDILKCLVTTLINGKECVFTVFNGRMATCAIELAWEAGKLPFHKPISCHLYPVRLGKTSGMEKIEVHKWYVCSDAWQLGTKKKIPLYVFLKDALIRKFGEQWYSQLEIAAGLRKK